MLEYLEVDGRGGDIARMPQNIDTRAPSQQWAEENINIKKGFVLSLLLK